MLAMRGGRWMLVCALAAAGLAPACGSRSDGGANAGAGSRPDIILVSIDSLRFDHLGCYGYAKPTSPNIDRIAEQGVRCESAVSTTSWTLPAHAALMTGLFDSTHGVVGNGKRARTSGRRSPRVARQRISDGRLRRAVRTRVRLDTGSRTKTA
jgi:hypothetical protein